MSTQDTVSIPKDLLRRVMAEVEDLRAAVADRVAEADTLRDERDALVLEQDALVTERDDLKVQCDRLQSEVRQFREAAGDMKAHAEAAAARRGAAATASAEAGRASAERERETLRDAFDQSESERRALERTHPLPPTRAPGVLSDADTGEAVPDEVLRRAYTAWCRRGSPLVSRSYLFAAFLREAGGMLPTSVRSVFRDRAAAGIAFSGNPAGVEYWLATAGSVRCVLPKPASPYEFTELAPVYDGTLTPDRLGSLVLARPDDAQPSGDDTFSLVLRGHVRPD